MNTHRSTLIRFAALGLTVLPLIAAAQAAPEPQRIEIRSAQGDAPRRDVSSVCPQIEQELREVLASAWQHVGQPGTVRVQFTLDGQRVAQVTTLSGPRRYHRWVRSAMQDVSCQGDRKEAQTFQFDIRFVDIHDQPERRAVAVLMK